MDLIDIFRRFIPKRWRRPCKHNPTSVVMLLRAPHFFGKEELRAGAERAWHVNFAVGANSKHVITQQAFVTLIKAGPHILNLLHQGKPYGGDGGPPLSADWRPRMEQKQAWLQHRAWAGFDYMGRKWILNSPIVYF